MARENRDEVNRDNASSTGSPQSGGSHSGGAARERERSIETNRETGRSSSGLTRGRTGGGSALTARGASPFTLMQRMARDMDRLFDQFGFGPSGLGLTSGLASMPSNDWWGGGEELGSGPQMTWAPEVEMFRRGDQLVIRADVPGVKKDDIHVDVENDVLTISGERCDEHEENREGIYRTERNYGQFYRAIPLPEGVNADACDASFQDGVLEVTLPAPRPEQRKAKRIDVR